MCVCVKDENVFFKHRNNQVSVSPTIFTIIKSMNILCLKNGNTQHGISGRRGVLGVCKNKFNLFLCFQIIRHAKHRIR